MKMKTVARRGRGGGQNLVRDNNGYYFETSAIERPKEKKETIRFGVEKSLLAKIVFMSSIWVSFAFYVLGDSVGTMEIGISKLSSFLKQSQFAPFKDKIPNV